MPLYSAGDCPVCADSGALIWLRAAGGRGLLVQCPLCGVAWASPPPPYELDEVLTLAELACDGI